MILENWGATRDEVDGAVVGDDIVANAGIVATRCITVAAAPDEVFPWLRQMGFGRAGWYSYDWIDNLGRPSAASVRSEWQSLAVGDLIPGGAADFEAVVVDPPRAFVMRLARRGRATQRIDFTLAYELREIPEGTRLVTRMRARINMPAGRLWEKVFLAPGDGIMQRRQLLNIARRCVTTKE